MNERTLIGIQYTNNPRIFDWNEMVDAIVHNLGEKASSNVVHFAIDMKAAMEYVGARRPNYEHGLIADPALLLDLEGACPEADHEYLNEHVFLRVFSVDSPDPETIDAWVSERFDDAP